MTAPLTPWRTLPLAVRRVVLENLRFDAEQLDGDHDELAAALLIAADLLEQLATVYPDTLPEDVYVTRRTRRTGAPVEVAEDEPQTASDFWSRAKQSAESVRNGPRWMGAGITLNPEHYVTYPPAHVQEANAPTFHEGPTSPSGRVRLHVGGNVYELVEVQEDAAPNPVGTVTVTYGGDRMKRVAASAPAGPVPEIVSITPTSSAASQQMADLTKRVHEQRRQLAHLNDVLRRKNVELDAMHFVWCSGHCETGMHRHGGALTQEIVDMAEWNTKRLVARWANEQRRTLLDVVDETKAKLTAEGTELDAEEWLTGALGPPARMDAPDGPVCGCGEPSVAESGVCQECYEANLVAVCPGCHAFGEERCAEDCPDLAIARAREADTHDDDEEGPL